MAFLSLVGHQVDPARRDPVARFRLLPRPAASAPLSPSSAFALFASRLPQPVFEEPLVDGAEVADLQGGVVDEDLPLAAVRAGEKVDRLRHETVSDPPLGEEGVLLRIEEAAVVGRDVKLIPRNSELLAPLVDQPE